MANEPQQGAGDTSLDAFGPFLRGTPEIEVISPSVDALEAARAAATRAKKEAPVRLSFVRRDAEGQPDPPLVRILRGERGGRGGDVRLRLLVSMLWMVRDDATLSFPARAWAQLLGLPDPETKGARRIKDALRWLCENKFLELETAPGHDSVVHLLEETGSGARYELPGAAYNRLRDNREAAAVHRYLRLPREFWTMGWLSILSGPAVAVLLILLVEGGESTENIWVSPSMALRKFALSEDTRTKGTRELSNAGLLEIRRRPVSPDTFEYRRVRNVYSLKRDVLTTGPAMKLVKVKKPGSPAKR